MFDKDKTYKLTKDIYLKANKKSFRWTVKVVCDEKNNGMIKKGVLLEYSHKYQHYFVLNTNEKKELFNTADFTVFELNKFVRDGVLVDVTGKDVW